MAKEIDIIQRTFNFAVNIVQSANRLSNKSQAGKMLSSQILRSGTSIGANIEEGQAAESKADFIHKYNIALKEARETNYWLRLLHKINTTKEKEINILIKEADEISKIIAQIIINVKNKR